VSHLTKIKTQISDLNLLKQALKELNYKTVENSDGSMVVIKGWNNESMEALLEIKTGGPYSIGVVRNAENNSYEFTADWWGVETYTGLKQEEIINKITQKYVYNSVLEKIKSKGYSIVKETTNEKQEIRLVLRKWD
jgi:hypothetical protein